MAAECGWHKADCHAAIAHTLARRLVQVVQRWPSWGLLKLTRAYCAGLGEHRKTLTSRQRWLRALPAMEVGDELGNGLGLDGVVGGGGGVASRPRGWPASASWPRHLPLWRAIYARAGAFLAGRLADPCDGPSTHFGGLMDRPGQRMVAVDCGDTKMVGGREQRFWRVE